MIRINSSDKSSLPKELNKIFNEFYSFDLTIESSIDEFLSPIKDDAYFVIEYPYVDKVHRDSYYSYFASKLNKYPRDCIRVSIFNTEIGSEDYWSKQKHSAIREAYRGYFVVRPTPPNIFGRTTIDKRILKENNFLICQTEFSTTCNGLKLNVNGFPYSSQDRETLKCAGTSLWSMMEYFSNRYAAYSSVLPSTIIETLKSVRVQRQLPSLGLTYNDLSYALKTYGFGTRVYAKQQFKSEFESLLSCYVESGIPIVIAVSNNDNIHHAYICCGREEITAKHLEHIDPNSEPIDFDEIKKQFVFIDDNHFPYQRSTLDKPCQYYGNPEWEKCSIEYFIAPLYPKIYLEAFEAKLYCFHFLKSLRINNGIRRVFLTSSRSYKEQILSNPSLTSEFKKHIISIVMPKFIWVCEISDKKRLIDNKCFGTVVLDATEPNINNLKPLIYFSLGDIILKNQNGLLSSINLQKTIDDFTVYTSNLKGF